MAFRFATIGIAAAALALAGCGAPPTPETVLRLDDLEERRIERYSEWRDARLIPPGEGVAVDLGPAPPGGVLRLGALEGEPHGEMARIAVYVGDDLVDDFETGAEEAWRTYRVQLAPHADGARRCKVVVASAQPLWVAPLEVVAPDPEPPPNLLVYLIDTLRADHMSVYGYARPTTPNIAAFAGDAVRFDHFVPVSSWTKPTVATLLTGVHPNVHGDHDRPDVVRSGLPWLAAALRASGYESHGFSTNVNVLPLWGFGDDFDRFVDVDARKYWQPMDDAIPVDRAIATLDDVADRPWFLYVHTMGPHDPYEPPEPHRSAFYRGPYAGDENEVRRQRDIDLYDGEIAYSDAQFGRMLEALRARGLYDNTIIVLLSDHGEEFFEHGGWRHGHTLFEEQLRAPLFIRLPNGAHAGARRAGIVNMADIAPTLYELLGLPAEPRHQGKSFRELLETGNQAQRIGYATLTHKAHSLRAAKTPNAKYIRDLVSGEERWYDLDADPGEQRPLNAAPPGGEDLAGHARRMAAAGAQGLHLLMTTGDVDHTVTGWIESPGLTGFELDYYEWKGEAVREGERVRFSLETRHLKDAAYDRDAWHREHAEQEHARLIARIPPETPARIRVAIDGEAIAAFEAPAAGVDPSGGGAFVPLDLAEDADAFDPAGLPREFGLYLWYVPDPEAIADENLDDDVIETLRALGYLE